MSEFKAVYLTSESDDEEDVVYWGVGVLLTSKDLLTGKEQQNMSDKELISAALMELSKVGIESGPEDSTVDDEGIE